MYKVYYETDNQDNYIPKSKDYKNIKWALRFAHKISQQDGVGWVDITNLGRDTECYHTNVLDSNFKWHNGQMFQYEELPKWMRLEEPA